MMRALAIACLLLSPFDAAAQAEDPDALITEGLALRRAGQDREALARFRRAHELAPSPRALAQIALAEQALGAWVDARAHLAEALRATDDAWVAARAPVLSGELASLEARLGQLEIDGASGELSIDGVARGTLPLSAPLWVMPGLVVVEVTHPGHHLFQRPVPIEAGQRARVLVQLVAIEQPAIPAAEPEPEPPAPIAPRAPPVVRGRDDLLVGGVVSLVLSITGLAVGVVSHIDREIGAELFNRDACAPDMTDETRRQQCPEEYARIRGAEAAMGIAYGLSAALAITGAVMLYFGIHEARPATACAPTMVGVVCHF